MKRLLLASIGALSFGACAAHGQPAAKWTGTWSAAMLPMRIDPDSTGATNDFARQTLRQAVRISIGGTAARIRLSNAFGTAPVTISDVHVALAASDRSTVAGSDRLVTFGGSRTIVLQPGQEVVSDPLAMTLQPNSDLSVSMYFPKAIDAARVTAHRQAWQQVYFAAGDVSGRTDITPKSSAGSLFFLTGVDVVNARATGSLVALGASITDSSNSSWAQNKRWTNLLSSRLASAGLTVGVLNMGLSGNHLLSDQEFGGPSAFNRFERDVLSRPNVRWVIFSDDPINDLSGRFGTDVQPLNNFTSLVRKMIDSAHAKGIKFYCSTLTPNQGRPAGQWSDEAEARRQQINDFYRSPQSGCDGIVDQAAATRDPAKPLQYRPAFNAGDFLHPNDAGMQAIANSVNLGSFTANGVPPFTAPDPKRCGILLVGQGIRRNQPLKSCDGRFEAWLQNDGNFVIYQAGVPLGASNTDGSAATIATLLADGSFALYDDQGKVVWRTQTEGLLGQVLLLQNDGNFVLYDEDTPWAKPVWASNTFGRKSPAGR